MRRRRRCREEGAAGSVPVAAWGRSRRVRLLVVGAAFLGYALLFAPLHGRAGGAAAAAGAIVVVLAGALLGQTAGVVVALGFIPAHLLLFTMIGAHVAVTPHVLTGVVFAAIGGTVGRLRDLGARQRQHHAELQAVLEKVQEARAVVAEREAQLALAQEIARTGSWVSNLETGVTTWSEELSRILGAEPGVEPSAARWLERVHPEDRARVEQAREAAHREGRSAYQHEYRIVRPDGTVRWIFGRGQLLLDAAGLPRKLLGTVQDVTDLRELQTQLAGAERMAAVGTLARGMAHEINNPLSYLASNVRFLARELEALAPALPAERAAELAAAAREALQGADQVGRIVRDLMVFTQPDERAGSVQVERVIDLAVTMVGREVRARARLVKDFASVPRVQGDAWQLGNAFRDLLLNAVQAIPTGDPAAQEIRVVTRSVGSGRVAIEFRDTGVGMPPEVKRRVFEPYFTTRPEGEGRGMGLSTCMGIVRALGGEIAVESEPGRGSAFTVTLPTAPPAGGA